MRMISTLIAILLVLAWAALSIQGVLAYQSLESTGSGFTRGSNRISAFLTWEFYGLIAAIGAYFTGRIGQLQGSLRLVAKIPLWISGGFFAILVAGFVGLLLYTRLVG